jgi:hypothetical protein
MDRRHFLRTSCGMAAAFVAMPHVFGNLFDVSEAEAANPECAADRAKSLQGQFIFDDQIHFVQDKFEQEGLLGLAIFAAEHWNPALTNREEYHMAGRLDELRDNAAYGFIAKRA